MATFSLCAPHTPVLALKPGSAGAISLHVPVGRLIANTAVTGSCDDISQIVVMLLVMNENLNDYGTTTAQSAWTLGRVVVGTVAYIIRAAGCPDETVVHNVLVAN